MVDGVEVSFVCFDKVAVFMDEVSPIHVREMAGWTPNEQEACTHTIDYCMYLLEFAGLSVGVRYFYTI
jgi:hypothetical protein